MRIVIAVHGTERYSGIPKYSYLLAIALMKKGVDVRVVLDSSFGQHKLSELYSNGVTVETAVVNPPVRNFTTTAKYGWNLARYLSKNDDFDILHATHVTPFFYLRKRNRKPVVFQPFGNELFTLAGKGLNSLYCRLTRPVLRFCGHKADILATEGEFQHADMSRWYRRPESELRILPLGIDLPSLPIKRTYARQDTTRFLAVNSLYKYEGMDLLINALKTAYRTSDRIALTIVGSGPEEKHLKELASGYPIEFLQEVSEQKLGDLYLAADAFVCTSRETDYQMGILEAMAVGLPVLSTPKSWLPQEVVQIAPDKLAHAMLAVSTWTGEQASAVGKCLHQATQKFNFSRVADRAIEIYEELM